MAWYRSRHKGSGGITPVGDAVQGDVISGKTFTNATDVGLEGTMPNNGAVSATLDTSTTSYTVPAGYHNGSGTVSVTTQTKSATPSTSAQTISADSGKVLSSVSVGAISTQEKSCTPSTSAQNITPDSGKYLSKVSVSAISTETKTQAAGTSNIDVTPSSGKYLTKVTVTPTPSQTKSASPSTSAQTISPDSGKLLSSVSIGAISPQRSAGVAATTSGLLNATNLTGYVYFPYGWHPNANTTYGNYCSITQAQAQAAHYHTATATVSTRGSSVDIGQTHSYRYVNTNGVPNSNSGTKTLTSSDANWLTGNVDMGATNTYRYVNASNVYYRGIAHCENNHGSYIAVDGYGRGESSVRQDIYNIQPGTTITVSGMSTSLNKRVQIYNQNHTLKYDSGYTTAASVSYTQASGDDAMHLVLFSATGVYTEAWYNFTNSSY